MTKVSRFEDLKCWQKARELVGEIYKITNDQPLSKDYKLRDQLRGAAVSAMSNIAEGFSRYYKKDFIRFLDIAQSSAAEVKSLMYVVSDQNYVAPTKIEDIQKLADDCRFLTLGLLKYCNQNLNGGSKKVNEPEATYIENEDFSLLNLPDKFINLNTGILKTQTLEHSNT